MNPLTNTRNITKLNEREITLGISDKSSWHSEYKDSAWIFVGGLSYDLTEGDVICVFSQYGEIVNVNLVRDKKTGKSKGYCFICFEDQRSTILAVDNFNGIKLCNRTIRVDHVANYRMPKDAEDVDEVTKFLRDEGCAPKVMTENKETMISNSEVKKFTNTMALKKEETRVKNERDDPPYNKYSKVERPEGIQRKDHKKSERTSKRSHRSDSDTDDEHAHKTRSSKTDSHSGSRHIHKHRSKEKHSKHKY